MEETRAQRKTLARRVITVQLIVDITLWLTVALPVLYLFMYGRPRVQGFFCDDLSLSYPYKPDTISTPVLVICGFAISVGVIVLVEVFSSMDFKCRKTCVYTRRVSYCMKAYAVFLVGFVIEELFVDVIKNKMGVLRPNFFDVCKPEFNRTLCPGCITEYICYGKDDSEILKSRQSFPSGHSAFSAYIALYFCIYIQKSLKIKASRILKVFLQTGLILATVLCGIERITDNKHHLSDILAGFFVGCCVAVFVWGSLGDKALKHRSSMDDRWVEEEAVKSTENTQNCCSSCRPSFDREPQTPEQLFPFKLFHVTRNVHTKDICDRNVVNGDSKTKLNIHSPEIFKTHADHIV